MTARDGFVTRRLQRHEPRCLPPAGPGHYGGARATAGQRTRRPGLATALLLDTEEEVRNMVPVAVTVFVIVELLQ